MFAKHCLMSYNPGLAVIPNDIQVGMQAGMQSGMQSGMQGGMQAGMQGGMVRPWYAGGLGPGWPISSLTTGQIQSPALAARTGNPPPLSLLWRHTTHGAIPRRTLILNYLNCYNIFPG